MFLSKNKNISKSSNISNYKLIQKESLFSFSYPNVSLSNWVGSPEIFEECYEIISYQTNNTNYQNLGAVLPKGILLEGPPGVGKTYLAKAIATETKSSFISVSGSEFVEMYVGVGASRVRELFKLARYNRPSIIFIDEIDAIGAKRNGGTSGSGGGGSGSNREHDQTLNQLLTEMDGFKDNSEIIVLAATNRKDTLDSALLRPGRFDRHIHISLPDKYSREQILKLYLDEKRKKERGINVSMIAELTDGFSGADLKNLINEAAILAARRGGKKIKSDDITNAMEKLVVGLERKNDDRSEEAKYRVSIHEVGHGFLSIYFDKYFDLKKISIKSTYNGAGGYTLMTEKTEYKNGGLYTKDLLFKKIIILLGGKAAESIWYGGEQVSLGATHDLKQANQLARKMVEIFGMGTGDLETFYNTNFENNYNSGSSNSEKTKEQIDGEILGIISNAYSQSKEILEKNKIICDELVDKLLTQQILYRKDMDMFYVQLENK
jgi:cell division protease FtsH